ncbi:hypothetical protein BXT86_06185 [candidate division WOR-3 bacterium 4484_100]|uniref:Lipopolysaccharide-assembly n=1 Tax=candidate division WOR-3 bacterium 4484_100 TaxID=1936077 RepID=A0A1V4QE52_UNCW3|nr:MAG: hypothetical protein BXT86_06185 [candidate division WOR-3 bacterium 4484_100]
MKRLYINLTILLFIACCGYSTRSLLPGYMQRIHIRLFENNTVKPGLDELATEEVINAFRNGSNLKIVDEASADLLLEGKVAQFNKEPHTYTANQEVIEYKITIGLTVRCVDRVKNSIFWEGTVSDWALYSTDEDEGIKDAMKKTAEKLVTTILTNW